MDSFGFPRTRGDRPVRFNVESTEPTVPPAHAGIDRVFMCGCACILRLPRTRGDRPLPRCSYMTSRWVPPHTRG